jgi:hypothetical protein
MGLSVGCFLFAVFCFLLKKIIKISDIYLAAVCFIS